MPSRWADPDVQEWACVWGHAALEPHALSRSECVEFSESSLFHGVEESLGARFQELRTALGPAVFEDLCSDYLCAHPSKAWDMTSAGDGLAEFIRSWPGLEAGCRTALAELAR